MRIFPVLVAGLLLTGCHGVSGALTPEAKAERRARILAANAAAARGEPSPAPAAAALTYRGTEGFSGTVWGMTPAEVQAAFPTATAGADGGLTAQTTVDGRPATLGFVFTRGLLAAVEVTFAPHGAVREEHAGLRQVLVREYGAPTREYDAVAEAEERVRRAAQPPPAAAVEGAVQAPAPDPALLARREALAKKALEGARARALVDTEWTTQESALLLHAENTPVGPQLKLHYLSLTLAPQLQAEREQARSTHAAPAVP